MNNLKNKRASSIVLLAMVFVGISIAICGAIVISRKLVVNSECKIYSNLWTKAILSEYDIHLLEDYGIMAYFGNELEVQKRIDIYMDYTLSDRLDANIDKSSAELYGYELGDINNFKKALSKSTFLSSINTRIARNSELAKEEYGSRAILNNVVIDTLPSNNNKSTINTNSIIKSIKNGKYGKDIISALSGKYAELTLLNNCFGNHVTYATDKKCFLRNEWEYIIVGDMDDNTNFKRCKEYISLIRNALNLAFLKTNKEKQAVLIAASELINPEAAPAIKLILEEAWAIAETESDMHILLDNGRVPFVKTNASWQTDLGSILDKSSVKKKLDDESKSTLEMKKAEIKQLGNVGSVIANSDGQNYDEYLLVMMLAMNDNTRILRCMDLIQINMKYRYYRDFNMMEYFVGVRYAVKVNGYTYEAEDYYK